MGTEKKTSMSVREMGQLLGLKKTESYWLIHKQYFDTVLVNGQTRVVTESFEAWYADQIKYHKADGPPPGEKLKSRSYSVRDISKMLGIHESSAYDLVKREKLRTEPADGWMRIPKEEFERWYASQSRYRTEEDRLRDREQEEATFSLPEIGKMLGIERNAVYSIIRSCADALEIVTIAGRKRVTKESFENWYAQQDKYVKLSDRPKEELVKERIREEKKEVPRLEVDPNKKAYSVQETAILLDVDSREIYEMIRRGEIEAKKYGHVIRIRRDEIEWWLLQQHLHTEMLKED